MGAISGLLSAFFDIGSTIDGVLRGIGGFIGAIDGIVTEVTSSKAFREMNKALHKVEAELNKLVHVAEAFMKSVLKAMGLDVDGFENGMKRFEHRIEHFIMKSVNDALKSAKGTLTAELEKIPAVQSFESALGTLRDEMIALRNKVENELGADCSKVLTTLT